MRGGGRAQVPYPYRPDADFAYLTGVRTPHALAAISSSAGRGHGAFTLFVPEPSPGLAQWDGAPLNAAAAEEVFGANAAFPMSQVLQTPTRLGPPLSSLLGTWPLPNPTEPIVAD